MPIRSKVVMAAYMVLELSRYCLKAESSGCELGTYGPRVKTLAMDTVWYSQVQISPVFLGSGQISTAPPDFNASARGPPNAPGCCRQPGMNKLLPTHKKETAIASS